MILLVKTFHLLLCLAFITGCVSLRNLPKKYQNKKSLANHLAKKIISAIPQHIGDSIFVNKADNDSQNECKNEVDLFKYFFNVYSSNTTYYQKYLSSSEFDYLVKFQIQRGQREDFREIKHNQFKCKNMKKCFQSDEIFKKIEAEEINYHNFKDACPYLLYNNEMDECEFEDQDAGEPLKPLSSKQATFSKPFQRPFQTICFFFNSKAWVIGLLFAGIVTLWSWNGLIVFPVITTKAYKRVLCFMIALAFSCMSTNGLLNYVALADGFFEADLDNTNGTYFYKHLVMLTVIFLFFIFERTMKLLALWRTKKSRVKEEMKKRLKRKSRIYDLEDLEDEIKAKIDAEEELKIDQQKRLQRGLSINPIDINIIGNAGTITLEDTTKFEEDLNKHAKLCCTSLTEGISQVRPIGWMAIFGDGLGNFMDGLSIGASINRGLGPGLTTAIATWCSNIPQELGDFALLVRAGMTPFQALFYNYLSGNAAFVGCVIGIYYGDNIQSARWIFSISAGTTLFLSLGVLLPEINEEFENSRESLKEKVKITFVQIAGMLIGYFVVIMLNAYEDSFSV